MFNRLIPQQSILRSRTLGIQESCSLQGLVEAFDGIDTSLVLESQKSKVKALEFKLDLILLGLVEFGLSKSIFNFVGLSVWVDCGSH